MFKVSRDVYNFIKSEYDEAEIDFKFSSVHMKNGGGEDFGRCRALRNILRSIYCDEDEEVGC